MTDMKTVAARNLRSFIRNATFKHGDVDRDAANVCVDVLTENTAPANPAQGVGDLLLAAAEMAERSATLSVVYQPREAYARFAQECRAAAIGAGGQAVLDPWSEVRELMKKEPQFDWDSNQDGAARQHYVDRTRRDFLDLLYGAIARAITHPAPSGQAVAVAVAVAVKALEEIEADIKELDALPPSIQSQRNIRIINAFNRTRSALSNPPAQPGWRDMERDAERWNALLRCARIRMQGSAGFDPKTGERQEYSNSTGKYTKGDTSGWVHFGAEFWSVYPGAEDYEGHNQWGRHALTALADDVLLKARQAIPAAPLPGGAK